MTLWAGYWRGKEIPEPILTEMPKMKVDKNLKPKQKITRENLDGSVQNTYVYGPEGILNYANAKVVMEGVPAGGKNQWYLSLDNEVQYILKGKATIRYSLEGTFHGEIKTLDIEEGDVYIIPRGARLQWVVDPNEDLVRLCILIPGMPATIRVPGTVEDLE